MMMMMFDLCPLNSSLIQAIVILFDQNNSILHADDTIQLFTIG